MKLYKNVKHRELFLPRLISMKQSKSEILINLPQRVILFYTLRTISGPAGLLFGPKVVSLPLIAYFYACLFAGVILLNHGNMLLIVHFHREAFRKIPNLRFSCRSSGLESFDYNSITLISATRNEHFCDEFSFGSHLHILYFMT